MSQPPHVVLVAGSLAAQVLGSSRSRNRDAHITASTKIGPITISSSGRVALNPRDRGRPSPLCPDTRYNAGRPGTAVLSRDSRDSPTYGVARGTSMV